MDYRQLARLIAIARIGIGALMLIAPGPVGRLLAGSTAGTTSWLLRSLGIRDLVLGIGAYGALRDDDQVKEWVGLGAACDAIDGAASLLAIGKIPTRTSALTSVAGLASAGIGALASRASGRP